MMELQAGWLRGENKVVDGGTSKEEKEKEREGQVEEMLRRRVGTGEFGAAEGREGREGVEVEGLKRGFGEVK